MDHPQINASYRKEESIKYLHKVDDRLLFLFSEYDIIVL